MSHNGDMSLHSEMHFLLRNLYETYCSVPYWANQKDNLSWTFFPKLTMYRTHNDFYEIRKYKWNLHLIPHDTYMMLKHCFYASSTCIFIF